MDSDQPPASTGTVPAVERFESFLVVGFALFLFCSAFSIAGAQIALGVSAVTFIGWMIAARRIPSRLGSRCLYGGIGLYVGWLVVASLASASPLSSLAALREEWLFVILPLGIFLGRRPKTRSTLLLALAVGLLLAGTYGVIQHFTGVYWYKSQSLHSVGTSYRLSGNFSHPLTYGYFVATASVFFLNYLTTAHRRHSGYVRALLMAATVAGLAATVLCNSRGPLVALGVGLIATGLGHRKVRHLLIGLVVAAILAWFLAPGMVSEFSRRVEDDLHMDNRSGRLYIWNQSLDIVADNPLTGVGPSNFKTAYAARLPYDADPTEIHGHAHNDFLNIAAMVGLPGLFFYVAVWAIVMVSLYHRSRESSGPTDSRFFARAALMATVVFCTASLFEAAFADEELRQLITALWALGLSDS